MRLEQSTDIRACFFDLEAEYERGICRDDVCMDKDKEKGALPFLEVSSLDTE